MGRKLSSKSLSVDVTLSIKIYFSLNYLCDIYMAVSEKNVLSRLTVGHNNYITERKL